MDKRICVYEAGETDFAGNGLGTIAPTRCEIHWEENGEYSVEIEHPIDNEVSGGWSKYERLATDRTVVVPVPEAPSMRLRKTESSPVPVTLERYTIATRQSRLRLRSGPGTNYRCLGYYAKGKQVTLIHKTSSSWYEVTAPDGKHGYMSAHYLSYAGTIISTETNPTVTLELLRDLPMRPQPFDIYSMEPGVNSVSVKGRHVFYRLAANIVCQCEIKKMTAQQALDAVFGAAIDQDHGFSWYAEDTESLSLEDPIEGKNLVDILLGENGICEAYGLKLLVDWFDIFLVKDIGADRGVQIRYAKNLLKLEGGFDTSNVVTRIIPVGRKKDGDPLYLSGTRYVESMHADAYPYHRYGWLSVNEAKVSDDMTAAQARQKMQAAAQAELDAGCDLPECSLTAEMALLRHDPAYAEYASLERLCPGDTLGLFVPAFGLAMSICVCGYGFDALSQRYEDLTLGSPGANLSRSGISSRQLGRGIVTTSKLGYGSVGSDALQGDVIAARHIQADSINTRALQAESVTANKVAAGSITAEKIDTGAITTEKLAADSVTAEKIAAGAIDASKISAGTITADKLISDLITAGSGLIAVGAIGTAQIADGSITAAKIVSLNADVIEAGTISADKIILVGDGGVIYELNVAASGLQLSELSDEKYKSKINGTVLVAKSVTADQIAAKTITANEIASNTITADQVNIANLFAAQATIDAINTMDITSNTYLRLLVGSGEIGGRNYIRNSESVLGENFSIIGTSGGGVYMDGSALVIIYGVTTSQNGEVLSIS